MSNNSSENYLDNLLESISEIDNSKKTEIDFTPENIFGDDPFGKKKEPESMFKDNPFEEPSNILEQEKKGALSADDEFLREFEKELESDAYKDYFSDIEAELEEEKNQELELKTEKKGIPDNLDSILQGIGEKSKEVEPVLAMPDPRTKSAEDVLNRMEKNDAAGNEPGSLETGDGLGDISALGDIEEIGEAISKEPQLAMTESGEPDLAGVGDEDLIDLLAKADGLSDLGDILKNDESDIPLEEEDSIGKFAEAEMKQEEQEEQDEEKGKKRKKKFSKGKKEKGKGGTLDKLKLLLFGEDEEEEPKAKVNAETAPKNTAAELSDENAQILAELENEEAPAAKKAKKKKEKVKKEKKKPAKEKKPKQKKAPKPKKEKKPKEKDNTPPLPKKPVILIFLMVISFVTLILVGTSLLNYSSDVNLAKEMYQQGSYCEGYERLQGQKIKEKDEIFYEQAKVLATVDSQYQAYLVFLKNGQQIRALDSLVCAAGRYELNMENAVELECEQEYYALGEKIENEIAGYDMTLEEAIMMYNKPNRVEYTKALEGKLSSLGLE